MTADADAWPTGGHVFLDESKESDYILVAASIVASNVGTVRSQVKGLRHKGSKSIHMRKESPKFRQDIISRLVALPVRTHVIESTDRSLNDLERRFRCLEHVLAMCAKSATTRLLIERDESILKAERQFFIEAIRRHELHPDFRYDWLARDAEPLLWVPDVVAWSYAKGGRWRAAVGPLVSDSTRV